MDISHLLRLRLANQQLAYSPSQSVPDIVSWLGAVQSQEFTDAKWSIGQRIPGLSEAAFNEAFNAGTILRTHVLRPTWHFVSPADIRWMLALTAPRIKAFMRTNDRKLGLDEAIFARSNTLIQRALEGSKHLTRPEVAEVLKQNGIPLVSNALAHLLARAEIDGIICSGAMRSRQHTYALLEERAPQSRVLTREEALAELTFRYFSSHGPATIRDFSWWSGLTLTDVRLGLEAVKTQLASETIEGNTYWYGPSSADGGTFRDQAYLLPNFDEYVVAYADRKTLLEPSYEGPLHMQGAILSHRTIVLNGRIVGTWKVVKAKSTSTFTMNLSRSLSETETGLVEQAWRDYRAFYH
ncbi:winged helix DNA-binding domain-containing protein [Spirosoma soli]|uniref:Winged helix DNA-binding domain-containing protein n=1 Tax=Spirosoma soli TaxID=1770529 RepID=A0ABW5MA18_9BACT